MKVNRKSLLEWLKFASLGIAKQGETIEQSNSFVFTEGELITFNDEVMTRSKNPLDITGAVLATEFLRLVEKFPDDELDITIKGEEVIIKGTRRSAGVTRLADIHLPYDAVPVPKKTFKLDDRTLPMLLQAARTCGKDVTQELTMLVHVTPKIVEACDNFRMFRATLPTGFPAEGLMTASSILLLETLTVKRVGMGDGWVHFKLGPGQSISLRCSAGKYHENIDGVLDIGEASETTLPDDLEAAITRSLITMSDNEDPNIRVTLTKNKLMVESRKAEGWYKETKSVKHTGGDLSILIHPKFLVDMLKRTKKIQINPSRMKMEADGIEFVVAMIVPK